jgi:ABC-2 type transport system ATP-binding protein
MARTDDPRTKDGRTDAAVWVRDLTRSFKVSKRLRRTGTAEAVLALGGVDLTIARGQFYGILGPNGAGKTTLLKILTTLLSPTSGEAYVAGFEVVARPRDVRRRISLVSGGDNAGYGILTVRETLWMFGQFYGVATRDVRERGARLMHALELEEKADERVNRLSTGFKQRLNFARGFVSEPEIIFLDEPTLGLDVSSARHIRGFLREWVSERPGRTVVLTTHYMAEADELCDEIAIIDHGRILAVDTPSGLRTRVAASRRVVLELDARNGIASALGALPGVRHLRTTPPGERGTVTVHLSVADNGAINGILDQLARDGHAVHNLSTHDPSLEDVFVAIVGRGINEHGDADAVEESA